MLTKYLNRVIFTVVDLVEIKLIFRFHNAHSMQKSNHAFEMQIIL